MSQTIWPSSHVVSSPLVLVVDSDADTLSLYQHALTLAGFEVIESADGRDALVKALVRQPALVISEICLPVVDGCSLCDILRRDRTTANIPILIVTSEARAAEIDRVRRAGADAVLVKPTTPDHLLNAIGKLIAVFGEGRRSSTRTDKDAVESRRTAAIMPAPDGRRTARAKAHLRLRTSTPSTAPPVLWCPTCNHQLVYERSHIGGSNSPHSERWDDFRCPACRGSFEFRERTRKITRVC